jgi:hypothetical protein
MPRFLSASLVTMGNCFRSNIPFLIRPSGHTGFCLGVFAIAFVITKFHASQALSFTADSAFILDLYFWCVAVGNVCNDSWSGAPRAYLCPSLRTNLASGEIFVGRIPIGALNAFKQTGDCGFLFRRLSFCLGRLQVLHPCSVILRLWISFWEYFSVPMYMRRRMT